ncbi:hypothetical protein FRB97_000875 [Tulasnella sp. 331]|nr:hypothetical protein FRB97_000875 [Tulasnella sp. 331]
MSDILSFKHATPSTGVNETEGIPDNPLKLELDDTIFQVKYGGFDTAYLPPPPSSSPTSESQLNKSPQQDPYLIVASQCLKVMEAPELVETSKVNLDGSAGRSPPVANTDSLVSSERHQRFDPLINVLEKGEVEAKSGHAMYNPLVESMPLIPAFFRDHGLCVDENWSKPTNADPTAEHPVLTGQVIFLRGVRSSSPTTPNFGMLLTVTGAIHTNFLTRVTGTFDIFGAKYEQITDDKIFGLSPLTKPGGRLLNLDIALLLRDQKIGRVNEQINHDGRDVLWKYAKVAAEVKFDTRFYTELVTQVARYTRAVKVVQVDRNFS